MIQFRWIQAHYMKPNEVHTDPNNLPQGAVHVVDDIYQVLQFRTLMSQQLNQYQAEDIHSTGSNTYASWTDWKDVPVVWGVR
jgi:hypothetical protein